MTNINDRSDFPTIDENIESVSKSSLQYFIKRPSFLLKSLFWFILSVAVTVIAFQSESFGFVILPFFVASIIVAIVTSRVRREFMRQFANVNNYGYQEIGDAKEFSSPYLTMRGDTSSVRNVVNADYKGCPLTFFNFSGIVFIDKKHGYSVNFTACRIQYKTDLPEIFVEGHHQGFFSDSAIHFKHPEAPEKIALEGDFNKYFNLYIPKEYQIEALEIFTPDIMAALIDYSKNFSIEISGNCLYIYAFKWIDNKKDLYRVYDFARFLILKLTPKFERMKG